MYNWLWDKYKKSSLSYRLYGVAVCLAENYECSIKGGSGAVLHHHRGLFCQSAYCRSHPWMFEGDKRALCPRGMHGFHHQIKAMASDKWMPNTHEDWAHEFCFQRAHCPPEDRFLHLTAQSKQNQGPDVSPHFSQSPIPACILSHRCFLRKLS